MPVTSLPVPDVVGQAMCGAQRTGHRASLADRLVDIRQEVGRMGGIQVRCLGGVDHRPAADRHVAVELRLRRECAAS